MNVYALDGSPMTAAFELCREHVETAAEQYGAILAGGLALMGELPTFRRATMPAFPTPNGDGLPNRTRFVAWVAEEPGAAWWLAEAWAQASLLIGDPNRHTLRARRLADEISDGRRPERFALASFEEQVAREMGFEPDANHRLPKAQAVEVHRAAYMRRAATMAAEGRPMQPVVGAAWWRRAAA